MVGIYSSKPNIDFAEKETAFLTLSADQTTSISAGDPIRFDTSVGDLTLATYKVTLKAKRKYKLISSMYFNFSGNTGDIVYQWYDTTNGAYIGVAANVKALTSSSNINNTTSFINYKSYQFKYFLNKEKLNKKKNIGNKNNNIYNCKINPDFMENDKHMKKHHFFQNKTVVKKENRYENKLTSKTKVTSKNKIRGYKFSYSQNIP